MNVPFSIDGCCPLSGCQSCCQNIKIHADQDLSSGCSSKLSTMREFINSTHPLMKQFKEKMAFMDFGSMPPVSPESPSSSDGRYCRKSEQEAKRLKNLGDKSYKLKRYEEASKYYSESIATAPIGSEELALAFVNRSKVLLDCGKYDFGLLDLNRALEGKIPEDVKQKLLSTKRKTETLLENLYHARKQMREKILGPDKPLTTIQKNLLTGWRMQKNYTDLTIDYSLRDNALWKTKLKNVPLPDASSKVRLECNEEWGWHLVATEDIVPGDVLLIQEYNTIIVRNDKRHIFCAYCAQWCEALIPCLTCSWEMYCSESCRQNALKSYHGTECKLLPLLCARVTEYGLPVLIFPLRMFLTGTKQGSELTKLMDDPNVYAIVDKRYNYCAEMPYVSNGYLAILNLLWKIYDDVHIIPCAEKLFNNVITILYALRRIKFFDNKGYASQVRTPIEGHDRVFLPPPRQYKYIQKNDQEEFELSRISLERVVHQNECGNDGFHLNEGELFAALLLLQHMRLMSGPSNFTERLSAILLIEVENQLTHPPMDVGAGLGSLRTIMNHSCDANTGTILNRRRLLVYSTRPIPAGEQIFTSFYSFNGHETREQRQKFLSRWRSVECTCTACVENWPVMTDLLKRENVCLTSDKDLVDHIILMHGLLIIISDPNYDFVSQHTDEHLQRAFAFNKTIRNYLEAPSPAISLCELSIRKLMRVKSNYYNALRMERIVNMRGNLEGTVVFQLREKVCK